MAGDSATRTDRRSLRILLSALAVLVLATAIGAWWVRRTASQSDSFLAHSWRFLMSSASRKGSSPTSSCTLTTWLTAKRLLSGTTAGSQMLRN